MRSKVAALLVVVGLGAIFSPPVEARCDGRDTALILGTGAWIIDAFVVPALQPQPKVIYQTVTVWNGQRYVQVQQPVVINGGCYQPVPPILPYVAPALQAYSTPRGWDKWSSYRYDDHSRSRYSRGCCTSTSSHDRWGSRHQSQHFRWRW